MIAIFLGSKNFHRYHFKKADYKTRCGRFSLWHCVFVYLHLCTSAGVFVFVQKVTGNPTQDGLQKKAWMFLRGAVTASLCRRCGRPQPLHIIPSRSWLLAVCHSYQRQTETDKGRQRLKKTDKDREIPSCHSCRCWLLIKDFFVYSTNLCRFWQQPFVIPDVFN